MTPLTQNWWALALRGIVAILFGVVAFLMPGPTLLALVFLFAAFAFVDGVFALVSGIRRAQGGKADWMLIVGGLAGIAVGILGFASPDAIAVVLLAWIAAWAILTGIVAVVAAYRLREALQGEWLLALNGIVSVIFGLYLIFFPGAGAIAIVWIIALWAIVSGAILLVLAFRLRTRAQRTSGTRTGAQSA